jgi:hypothetical protein
MHYGGILDAVGPADWNRCVITIRPALVAAEPNTLVLDLTRSWTPSTANFSVIPKARGVPVLNHPTLWYHAAQKSLYQGFGGEISPLARDASSRSLSLWRLQLDDAAANGSWATVLHERHSAFAALARPVGGLSAFAGDSGYVLGGFSLGQDQAQADGDGLVLPGLVHYNMSSGALRNASATAYYGTGSAQRGQMVHVPAYGDRAHGLFAVLGGYSAPVAAAFAPGSGHLSFMNITLYDPATRQWHWQTADGAVPRPREEFCAAGAQSSNGTFEMWAPEHSPFFAATYFFFSHSHTPYHHPILFLCGSDWSLTNRTFLMPGNGLTLCPRTVFAASSSAAGTLGAAQRQRSSTKFTSSACLRSAGSGRRTRRATGATATRATSSASATCSALAASTRRQRESPPWTCSTRLTHFRRPSACLT